MKKTTVQFEDSNVIPGRWGTGDPRYTLYTGVGTVYGGWLLTNEGDPWTLNSLEDCGCDALIQGINAILSDPATPWEECNETDEAYLNDWLQVWGCG